MTERHLGTSSVPGDPDIEDFELGRGELRRKILLRDGSVAVSTVPVRSSWSADVDLRAVYDQLWLHASNLPGPAEAGKSIRVVDLFAGCGGMTLGVVEAARALGLGCEAGLAMDTHEAALRVYESNFQCGRVSREAVESVFGLSRSAAGSHDLLRGLAPTDFLLGGPPCQGHSNLNNHSRRHDDKNALFFSMARAAEVLDPRHVIIENVRDIVHDQDGVFEATREYLEGRLGYRVATIVIKAEHLGVPQRRHRMFLVATRRSDVELSDLVSPFLVSEPRSFAWACADLYEHCEGDAFNSAPRRLEVTTRRIAWLFDKDEYELPDRLRPPCHQDGNHSYKSVYGRLREDEPSQTITTGFSYMGQGRFVHPRARRTLTPHEAARLQFFPDSFAFGDLKRGEYGYLIGNAVPPKLTYVLALQLLR